MASFLRRLLGPDATSRAAVGGREEPPTGLWTFYVVVGLGLALVVLYALQFERPIAISVVATGVAAAGASAFVGGLLGFLFGIPRALQGDHPDGPRAADGSGRDGLPAASYRANTNLEQISDWLTKILVGVGLVQIGEIADQAQQRRFAQRHVDPTQIPLGGSPVPDGDGLQCLRTHVSSLRTGNAAASHLSG